MTQNTKQKIAVSLMALSLLIGLLFGNQIVEAAGEFKANSGIISRGSISVGKTTAADSKALLDMVSTTKGALFPRMTTTQRDNIATPPTGLTIYNTTTNKMNVYTGAAWAEVGGGGGGGLYDASQNLIDNNSWEENTTGWTASGSSVYARVTAAAHIVPPGVGAFSWDASASAETLTGSDLVITANDGLSGRNGVLSCAFKTAATDIKLQVYDGTNVISPNATTDVIPSSSAGFLRYSVNFIFPSSGTIKPRLYSQSDSAIAYGDDCFWGLAEGYNLSQVSQATMYGSATWAGTASCDWTTGDTTSALTEYGADAQCPEPTVTGYASAPSTKVPRIKFASLPAGNYLVVYLGSIGQETSATTAQIAHQAYDGTTGMGRDFGVITAATGTATKSVGMNAFFSYSTAQTNIEFRVRSSSTSNSNDPYILNGDTNHNFAIVVYRFPTSSQTAYTADQGPASWSGYHGTTCSGWTRTNTAFGDTATDASCTFTERTNRNFGTVITEAGSLPGITFTPKRAGRYEVCAHTRLSNATAGWIETAAQLTDGSTVYTMQGARGYSDGASGTKAPITMCGIVDASSTSAKTVKIQTASTSGAVSLADSSAATNIIEWTIKALDQSLPAPLLVNSVVSSYAGIMKQNIAKLNCDAASAITTNPGSWIASIGNISGGACTVTLTSGIFNAAPYCVIGGKNTDSDPPAIGVNPTSSTSVSLDCANGTTDCTEYDLTLMCMEPQ